MAQSTTRRRNAGQGSRNTNQKSSGQKNKGQKGQSSSANRQSVAGRSASSAGTAAKSNSTADTNRSGNAGRSAASSSAGNTNSGTDQRSISRQQNLAEMASRSSSGTMERGASGMRSPNLQQDFSTEKGQYLEKFFLNQLKDIYYAEQKIIQSLPKMADAATTEELREAFEDHHHLSQRHARRLEKIFDIIGQKADGKKCEAIEGIAREVEEIIEETEENTMTRDAALIIAAQKVEHYEIATYGGLLQLAITMGQYEVADLLDKTLLEEEDTDLLLTEIAECEINVLAEFEGGSTDEYDDAEEEDMEDEEDLDDEDSGSEEDDDEEENDERIQEDETQEQI